MPYALRKKRRNPKSTRRENRLARAAMQKNVTPYIVDPIRLYEYETLMLLRMIARWIYKRHYCPRLGEFAQSHFFRPTACKRYVQDLEASGLLFINKQRGIMLTPEGFARVHIEPCEPILPSDPSSRKALIREARATMRVHEQMKEVLEVV